MKAALAARLVAVTLLSVPIGLWIERRLTAAHELYETGSAEQIRAHLRDSSLTKPEWILTALVVLALTVVCIEFLGYFFGLWFRHLEARIERARTQAVAAPPPARPRGEAPAPEGGAKAAAAAPDRPPPPS